MNKKNTTFLPIGIGLGVAIGTAIGVSTDDLGLWLPIGVAIGAGLGTTGMTFSDMNDQDTDNNQDQE